MIDRLLVQDFQLHEKQNIRLDPHITTIVGPSDTGKSALLRALRWVCLNRPRGDGFIRQGAKRMRVRVKCGDSIVTRERGKQDNTYILDKQEYRAFRDDVPIPVQELLRLDEVNFQGQHDPPFWFSLSAPEVARQLNKIVDLETIDEVATRMAGKIREAHNEIVWTTNRRDEAQEQVKALSYATVMAEDFGVVWECETKWRETKDKHVELGGLVDEAVSMVKRKDTYGIVLVLGTKLVELGTQLLECTKQIDVLDQLIGEARKLQSLAATQVPDIQELEELGNSVMVVKEQKRAAQVLIQQIEAEQNKHNALVLRLKTATEQYQREFTGVCPVCGKEI